MDAFSSRDDGYTLREFLFLSDMLPFALHWPMIPLLSPLLDIQFSSILRHLAMELGWRMEPEYRSEVSE